MNDLPTKPCSPFQTGEHITFWLSPGGWICATCHPPVSDDAILYTLGEDPPEIPDPEPKPEPQPMAKRKRARRPARKRKEKDPLAGLPLFSDSVKG